MSFTEFVTEHEISIRLGFFIVIFLVMASWEIVAPRRSLTVSKVVRWTNNLGLVFINNFLLRILFPAAAVGMAAFAAEHGWGLFNTLSLPIGLSLVLTVIALDFIIYLQHVLMHAVPVLWRLHRMHHVDLDFDVTTGTRFHPIEIILSMLIKFATIAVLGPPIIAVVMFEVVLNATSMFNHGNVRLPLSLDRGLRFLVVTPDMHRVHHSAENKETNSNFGFNLSVWDRVFGTYIDQPREGHKDMTIGVHQYRDPKLVSWLPGMLILPFIRNAPDLSVNQRGRKNQDAK